MTDLVFRGRRVVFASALDPAEATARLAREVAAPAWRLRDERTELFEGTLDDGRFRVVRLVHGRNSFRPLIDGTLVPAPGGSRIEVVMRMHPLVLGLLAVLLGTACLVAIVAATELLAAGRAPLALLVLVAPPLVALGALALTAAEARKAVELLARVFDAKASRVG